MPYDQVVVLIVLAGALTLFVTEVYPLGVSGLAVAVALTLSGVVDAERVTAAFASPTIVLVGSLYVVSASLIRTGVVTAVGERVLRLGRGSEYLLLAVAMISCAVFSAVLNNTSIVVLMLPLALAAADRMGIAPSRLLMPISYAAIFGGTMTLIGTSTNVLVANLAREELIGFEPLGFLEFFPVGVGFAAVGLVYMLTIGRRLLPSRPTISSVTRGRAFEYVTELSVPERSPAVGMSLAAFMRRASRQVRVLQLIHGEEILDRFDDKAVLAEGDLVVLRGPPEAILELRNDLRLAPLPGAGGGDDPAYHGTTFAEIVITPASDLVGRTLAEIGLHRSFGVVAIALQRRGAHLRHKITQTHLRVGDVILVQGPPEQVERLRGQPGFLLLVGVEEHVPMRRRAPVAVGILGSFILLAAVDAMDITILAIAASTTCLLTGCISMRRAVREVDWNVLALIAGSMTLGLALHSSGLAERAGHLLVAATQDYGPHAVLSAIYLITTVTTEFVSNSGAAALMLPVAIATAGEIGVEPRPFIFAVAFGASASFSTPIGYQTNAFVFGPGGYRFRDFINVGTPLQVLLWAYASFAIPFFFPFE